MSAAARLTGRLPLRHARLHRPAANHGVHLAQRHPPQEHLQQTWAQPQTRGAVSQHSDHCYIVAVSWPPSTCTARSCRCSFFEQMQDPQDVPNLDSLSPAAGTQSRQCRQEFMQSISRDPQQCSFARRRAEGFRVLHQLMDVNDDGVNC